MAKRLPRLRLEWTETDSATGPDGTRYSVGSEHVRGERRYHAPSAFRPGEKVSMSGGRYQTPDDFPDEREVFSRGFPGTKAAAIRWCEVDAARRQEAAGG